MRNKIINGLSKKFTRDRRGVAAIEGAIILPLVVSVFIGLTDLSSASRLNRDLDRAAASIASIVVSGTRFDLERQQIVRNGLGAMIAGEAGAGRTNPPITTTNPLVTETNPLASPMNSMSSLSFEPAISFDGADPKMKVLVAGITNDGGTYRTDWTWQPYGDVDVAAPTSLFDEALPDGAFGIVVYVQKVHKSFFNSGALGNYTLAASYAARPTKTTRILK